VRAYALYVFVILILMVEPLVVQGDTENLVIEFFYHPDCGPCKEPKRIVEKLGREYDPLLVVEWQDMRFKDAQELFFAYQLNSRPCIVFNRNPNTALYDLEESEIREKIEFYLNVTDWPSDNVDPSNGISAITLPLVLVSGLIDGINPCAFSLLIFFLSFLYGIQRRRSNVIWMGLTYITGVFLGYITIGLGLLHTVSILGITHPFGLLSVVFLFIMGTLQLREAAASKAPRIRLKIPGSLVVTFMELTEKATFPIALVLGFIVSLFEFPCSGGVYIGIMVILSSGTQFISGLVYLILYNLMFVVPLLLILILASNTDNLLKMNEWKAESRRRLKLLSGILLILLAVITGFLMFFS
jgi:cytochrome c biogenesis protein CcdA